MAERPGSQPTFATNLPLAEAMLMAEFVCFRRGALRRSWAAGNWSSLASSILNGRWQSAGSILLAIRDDRPGIPLQAVVIQYTVACRRAVVAAHKISYKILILWTVPQPSSASDLVKIQRSVGHRCYAYRFFQTYHHTGTRVGLAPPSYVI
jgi:hypothetical protein